MSDEDVSDVPFHKSTFSEQGGCVEVGRAAGVVRVRDTKNRDGGVLAFTTQEWAAFVAGVKEGEFDEEARS